MAQFIKFTYDLLDKHSLSIVREIGREIGVKSATSKVKNELIEDIIKIRNFFNSFCA